MVRIEAKQEGIIHDPPSYASEYESVQLSNGPTVCLVGPTRTPSQNRPYFSEDGMPRNHSSTGCQRCVQRKVKV
jgi:hypothetical protein